MRRRLAALAVLGLAGCGSTPVWVGYEGISPPSGVEPAGKRAERQGGNDPDAGKEIFKLRPREGESIGYTVSLRNVTDRDLTVTGVVADEDRDGAFVPESIAGAPVEIPAGGRANVEVQGRVKGCDYGGQSVPLAGPELRMRDSEGEENTQEVALDVRIELNVQGC